MATSAGRRRGGPAEQQLCKSLFEGAPTDVTDGVVPVVLVEAMSDVLDVRKGVKAEEAASSVVAARTNAIVMAERLRAAAVANFLDSVGIRSSSATEAMGTPRPMADCEACGEAVAARWRWRSLCCSARAASR